MGTLSLLSRIAEGYQTHARPFNAGKKKAPRSANLQQKFNTLEYQRNYGTDMFVVKVLFSRLEESRVVASVLRPNRRELRRSFEHNWPAKLDVYSDLLRGDVGWDRWGAHPRQFLGGKQILQTQCF